jgi:hypothetical protein
MAELADALDLSPSVARRVGSTPTTRTMTFTRNKWVKSTYCDVGASCVIAQLTDESVLLGDNKDPKAPLINLDHDRWEAFVSEIKAGEFDLL